jgi:hypothetical protein
MNPVNHSGVQPAPPAISASVHQCTSTTVPQSIGSSVLRSFGYSVLQFFTCHQVNRTSGRQDNISTSRQFFGSSVLRHTGTSAHRHTSASVLQRNSASGHQHTGFRRAAVPQAGGHHTPDLMVMLTMELMLTGTPRRTAIPHTITVPARHDAMPPHSLVDAPPGARAGETMAAIETAAQERTGRPRRPNHNRTTPPTRRKHS